MTEEFDEDKEEDQAEEEYIKKYPELELLFDNSSVDIGVDHKHDWPKELENPCIGEEHEYVLGINTNDTFFYASADGDIVQEHMIPEIINIYKNYGHIGLICWAAKKCGYDPCIEYTENDIYQNTWKDMYGDLKVGINPMLENKGLDYRWSNEKLNLIPWVKLK